VVGIALREQDLADVELRAGGRLGIAILLEIVGVLLEGQVGFARKLVA
jgi:hypothetical protein